MNIKKWSNYFIINIIIFICAIMCFNYIIDPYQHYRKATIYSFDYSGSQRYLNPGLAKNYDYNSVIIGTSMTENFTLNKTRNLMNKPIKLSIAGGKSYEFKYVLDIAFSKNEKIETILLGLDVYSFLNDKKYSNLPSYLYDDNIFNDYKYLLNLKTLKSSFNVLFSVKNDKNKIEENYNHMFEWQINNQKKFNLNNLITNWNDRDIKFNHKKSLWDLNQLKNNLDNNLYQLIVKNKDTKFIIFFPPYSILTYKDWQEKEILDTILKFKEYIYSKLIFLENVYLYDFQIAKDVTHNLNNYKDITHYSQDVNYWIIDQIYSSNFLLNSYNIGNVERNFIEQVNQYQIDFNN